MWEASAGRGRPARHRQGSDLAGSQTHRELHRHQRQQQRQHGPARRTTPGSAHARPGRASHGRQGHGKLWGVDALTELHDGHNSRHQNQCQCKTPNHQAGQSALPRERDRRRRCGLAPHRIHDGDGEARRREDFILTGKNAINLVLVRCRNQAFSLSLLQARHRQQLRKFAAQDFPSAKQSRLDRAFGQAEAARRGGDIHVVKIKKNQRLAILRRQSPNRAPHRQIAILVFEASVRSARVRRFGNVVERNGLAPECGAAPNGRGWSPARRARWKRPRPCATGRARGKRAEKPLAPSLRRGRDRGKSGRPG